MCPPFPTCPAALTHADTPRSVAFRSGSFVMGCLSSRVAESRWTRDSFANRLSGSQRHHFVVPWLSFHKEIQMDLNRIIA